MVWWERTRSQIIAMTSFARTKAPATRRCCVPVDTMKSSPLCSVGHVSPTSRSHRTTQGSRATRWMILTVMAGTPGTGQPAGLSPTPAR